MYTVHVNDSLGVNLRIGLGRACLGLVALCGPTGLARFLLGLLFRLHDDCCESNEKEIMKVVAKVVTS